MDSVKIQKAIHLKKKKQLKKFVGQYERKHNEL